MNFNLNKEKVCLIISLHVEVFRLCNMKCLYDLSLFLSFILYGFIIQGSYSKEL